MILSFFMNITITNIRIATFIAPSNKSIPTPSYIIA